MHDLFRKSSLIFWVEIIISPLIGSWKWFELIYFKHVNVWDTLNLINYIALRIFPSTVENRTCIYLWVSGKLIWFIFFLMPYSWNIYDVNASMSFHLSRWCDTHVSSGVTQALSAFGWCDVVDDITQALLLSVIITWRCREYGSIIAWEATESGTLTCIACRSAFRGDITPTF